MSNRIAEFRRFWTQQLAVHDCDPGIYALKYLVRRQELNLEQRYWICWLYACTYNVATTWVLFNEFPDYENVCLNRLKGFNAVNLKRLPYQKDQKWLRGHLAPMLQSYREKLCLQPQRVFWGSCSYERAWVEAMELFKVGRYTAWMLLQAFNEVCELDWRPHSLELHHSSSTQHRAGLCRVAGRDDWAEDKHRKFSLAETDWLEVIAHQILEDVNASFPELTVVRPDYFSMETSLCAYSKLFRREKGRYIGYYLDRWAEDINAVSALGWDGINWDLLWECRSEGLPKAFDRRSGVDKSLYPMYLDTGEFAPPSIRQQLNDWYAKHPNLL